MSLHTISVIELSLGVPGAIAKPVRGGFLDTPVNSERDCGVCILVRNRHETEARSCAALQREDHLLGDSFDRARAGRSLDARGPDRRLYRSTSSPLFPYGMEVACHGFRFVNLAMVCAAHDSSVRLDDCARNPEHRRRSANGEVRISKGETSTRRRAWPAAVHGVGTRAQR